MSEFDWIARYFAPLATKHGAAGLRDDVAELSGAASIITVDAMVEGVHFLPTDPIDTVARKLVRVNVSDVIAKGALPDEAMLMLGWPKSRSETELAAFADALGQELSIWGASLIGGDTVTSRDGLFLSLTLTGRVASDRAPIRRRGAQAGDIVCVTGKIGGGFCGLRDALAGKAGHALNHYRVPEIPPLEMAGLIATHATASMDVSDGLIDDLAKLLAASGCGAELVLENIPLFEPTSRLEEVLAQATGGDDYQCLFTLPKAKLAALEYAPVTVIGHIQPEPGLRLIWQGAPTEMPKQGGFRHG